VCNRTGEELYEVARLPELLAGQLVHPVEWAASMETLRRSGVRDVMLCGPGKALRRFARAGIPGATVLVVATPSDLAAASSSEALAGSASTAVPS
jgi:malonyl CoA-acyl carrier protein transacylase